MKYYLILLILLYLIFTQLCYTNLNIFPEYPQVNNFITLKYNNLNKFNSYRDIFADIYFFDKYGLILFTSDIVLEKQTNSNEYKGIITIPSNSVFGLIKIRGIFREKFYYDLNEGNLWDVVFYDENKRPLPNSFYLSAVSRLNALTQNLNRNTDYQVIIGNLSQELKYHPDNYLAQLAYNTLLFEMRRINQTTYNQLVSDIINKIDKPNSEQELNAMVTSLRMLKKNSQADQLITDFVKKYPKSKFSEEINYKNLAKITKMDEFNNAAIHFINDFPESSYRNRVISALISSYIQRSEVLQLIQTLDAIKNVQPIAYSEFAMNILTNNKIKNLSDNDRKEISSQIINNKLIQLVNDTSLFNLEYKKPSYYSSFEWKIELKRIKFEINEVIGDYYLILNDSLKAIEYYNNSIKLLDNDIPTDLIENTLDLSLKNKKFNLALEIAYYAINNSSYNDNIIAHFKEAYLSSNRDISIFAEELKSLLNYAKSERMVRLYFEKMNKALPFAFFKTLDGIIQDFEQTKDKISVAYYWSSWCEPCISLIPTYSEIFNNYLDSTDVLIYSILTWERNKSDLKQIFDFIQKYSPEFPAFIDEDDIIPYRLGLTGLPTFVFVDSNGIIRFIDSGYKNIDEFVRNVNDKIYYMKNMQTIESKFAEELKMMRKY